MHTSAPHRAGRLDVSKPVFQLSTRGGRAPPGGGGLRGWAVGGGQGDEDMDMPAAAEDDYEEGLQQLQDQQGGPAGGGMGAINMGMAFGPEGGAPPACSSPPTGLHLHQAVLPISGGRA